MEGERKARRGILRLLQALPSGNDRQGLGREAERANSGDRHRIRTGNEELKHEYKARGGD